MTKIQNIPKMVETALHCLFTFLCQNNTKKSFFSECLLRLDVLRVSVLFCVFDFVRIILSWCPYTWHVYIVYSILSLNISPIYMAIMMCFFLVRPVSSYLVGHLAGESNPAWRVTAIPRTILGWPQCSLAVQWSVICLCLIP